MSKIFDVIINSHKQIFVILDKLPEYEYRYEPDRNTLLGTSGPFAVVYTKSFDGDNQAFAGRKFTLKLVTGEEVICKGQWWWAHPKGYISVGVSTLEELEKCYVFCGAHIEPGTLEEWLKSNTPKSEYYHYEKRRKM